MRKYTIITISTVPSSRPHLDVCWGRRSLFRYLNNNHLSKFPSIDARYVYYRRCLVLEDHRTTTGVQRVAYDGTLEHPKGPDITLVIHVEDQ